jgi:hypothetical protein
VYATGAETQFGRIYQLAGSVEDEPSPQQREVAIAARRVAVLAIALSCVPADSSGVTVDIVVRDGELVAIVPPPFDASRQPERLPMPVAGPGHASPSNQELRLVAPGARGNEPRRPERGALPPPVLVDDYRPERVRDEGAVRAGR